jgi:hypothetical protein
MLAVEVSDEEKDGARHWLDVKRLVAEKYGSVVFCFSWGSVFEERDFDRCDVPMIPLQGGKLPFMGKLTAVLDRFLGSK